MHSSQNGSAKWLWIIFCVITKIVQRIHLMMVDEKWQEDRRLTAFKVQTIHICIDFLQLIRILSSLRILIIVHHYTFNKGSIIQVRCEALKLFYTLSFHLWWLFHSLRWDVFISKQTKLGELNPSFDWNAEVCTSQKCIY